MEYDEAEFKAVGDIPPGLEQLAQLPERALKTIKTVGQAVIMAVYGQETATSFDQDSAVYAA